MLDDKECPQYTKCLVQINGVIVLNVHFACNVFKMDLLDFIIQKYNIPGDLSHVDFLAYLLVAGSILTVFVV
jgi:hypothetical protein